MIEVSPRRVVVHHWGQQGKGELRPFCKQHSLAKQGVEVVLIDRKWEASTPQHGDDFLRYKDPMTEGRTIAIGDIHGCSAALASLVRAIDPTPHDLLVFLGDYIDRGPDSRGVLEQVIALVERCTVVALMGNHEEMLLAALEGQSELRYWLKFGGTEALASYGYRAGRSFAPPTCGP